jgi:ubiquinone/menaquinone biosynthesis C-methylase UbiE
MKHNFSEIPKNFNPPITNTAYLIRRRLLQHIAKHIPELNGSVMDFGCGSKPYKSLFKVSEYIGVDFKGQGHSHENEIIDVYYDGHHLPFEDQRFDGIFSSEVFEHVFNLEEMLKELNRVLKPGGKLLVTCPFAICEHEVPNDFARYTSFGLKDLLERNGFEIVVFEKSGTAIETIIQLFISYFYTFVIRKIFGKIPVVRTAIRLASMFVLNVLAVFLNMLMPRGNNANILGNDLYMNNVVLAVKKA